MLRQENSVQLGNSTVASQSIECGTSIASHKPLVIVLSGSNHCSTCLRVTTLKHCAKCKEIAYCSISCQKTGWIDACHKAWCGKEADDWTDDERLIARLGYIMQIPGTEQRIFEGLLESNDCDISMRIADRIAAKTGFLKCNIRCWARKNLRNSFTILDDCFREIGLGVYPSASANYNHSCWPNAIYFFKGRDLVIKAIRDLEPNTEIQIAYLDIRKPEQERKTYLKEVYSFDCICEACEGFGWMRGLGELRRTADSQDRMIGNIDNYLTLARLSIDNILENRTNISFDWLSLEINQFSSVPQLFNYMAIRLCSEAFEDSLEQQDWPKATKYGLLVLNFYLHVLPFGYPVTGIFAGDLCAVMFNERHLQKTGEDISFMKRIVEFARWNLQKTIGGSLLDNVDIVMEELDKLT
ncbi:N-lysine methyltransferase SMYD2-B [Neolecta irregularis DAH-3]|uniref:N-lysine methyltransferase SMYD2-B n=1 Tax=Neolecta irregularis (strain DAH-3) TaxID=1198029 RepID=A0A1U7LQB9_NEOID|nr:N-lysine methyltransferase SMYD2-B [Neolecta irregularis DAH-3]|eukprot:OLL24866.1 N-lysine methyltransferase SMYD2-B [Neolecta irregularis DAH-3]